MYMAFDSQTLENLLYQPEGPGLDFKQAQYHFSRASDAEKSELLKDILALANSWRLTTAYILIGVQEAKGDAAKLLE
jgi:predicted HTH transcriptional regulator